MRTSERLVWSTSTAADDDKMEGAVAASALLTVEQAAEVLNVSVRFVRRLVAERRIAVHRLGRHVRLHRADLDAFVAQGRSEPLAAGAVRMRRPGRRG